MTLAQFKTEAKPTALRSLQLTHHYLSISHVRHRYMFVLHPLKIQPAHLNESFLVVANISSLIAAVFDYLNILQYRLLLSRVTILVHDLNDLY